MDQGSPHLNYRLHSALPMQRNDEVPTLETKVTFSLGTSERFWESDHISWDVEQKLGASIQVPCEVPESDVFAGDQ